MGVAEEEEEEVDKLDDDVTAEEDTRTVSNGRRKGPRERVALRSMPSPQVALNSSRTCDGHRTSITRIAWRQTKMKVLSVLVQKSN